MPVIQNEEIILMIILKVAPVCHNRLETTVYVLIHIHLASFLEMLKVEFILYFQFCVSLFYLM